MKKNIIAGTVLGFAALASLHGLGARPALYPDPKLTPGAVFPVDEKTVCIPGYTATVRNVPQSLKNTVLKEYGLDPKNHPQLEIDHFISLELGGSNDIKNLWPEIGKIPNDKDRVENFLHARVCDGSMSLSDAQKAITEDWVAVFNQIKQK